MHYPNTIRLLQLFLCCSLTTFSFVASASGLPEQPESITAVCNANINVLLSPLGNASILPSDVDAGSFDTNGPITGMSLSRDYFTCSDAGETIIVTLTVTGPSGSNTCFSEITVVENVAPIAVCQSEVFLTLPPSGSVTIAGEDVDAGSYDNCGGPLSLSLSQSTYTCADLGSSAIVMTATDASGNTNSCFLIMHVTDGQAPIAVCEADVFANLPPSGTLTLSGTDIDAGSYDNCGGALTYSVSPPTLNCSNVGTNMVVLKVTDGGGLTNSCISTIHVSDATAPTAVCQANVDLYLDPTGHAGATGSMLDAGSADNCGSVSLSISAGQTAFSCADVGKTFVLTLKVSDGSGNSNTCFSSVTIRDANPDADCDGVSNICDKCAGGNDKIDNNGDGLPDCSNPPAFAQIISAWKCGSNKVYVCHNGDTKCVNYNALANHIAHGDYLGPCNNAACPGAMPEDGVGADVSGDIDVHISREEQMLVLRFDALPQAAELILSDCAGRVVRHLSMPAGETMQQLDTRLLPQGLYFGVLQAGAQRSAFRVVWTN